MPPTAAKTMILRFRDLSTPPGETIARHRAIIDADVEGQRRGHVYWGWWSKAGERVPPTVFGNFVRAARSPGGLDVLLFDSGRQQLHRATVADIVWDPGQDEIATPDADATPAYYQERHFRAWFKLTQLDATPIVGPGASQALRQLSYVTVGDFFDPPVPGYDRFDSKQVASLEELRYQDRTIWFVRDYTPGDGQREIVLVSATAFEPSHFPPAFHLTTTADLLWASDVHHALDGHHAFPLESDASRKTLGDRIESTCRAGLPSAVPPVAGIDGVGGLIVSGDLTWRADPEEYDRATKLIRHLGTWAKLDVDQIGVCPGNHDVAFSANPAAKGARVDRATVEAEAAYRDFYTGLFYNAPGQHLASGRRLLLRGAVPVEIALLNSSALQQSRQHFQGQGFVGEDQLTYVAHKMGWTAPAQDPLPVRLVVVHHHIVPVTYREEPVAGRVYSVLLDAEALMQWLVRHRVQVVLHGHMHTPFYTAIERPESFAAGGAARRHKVHVFGMGSSGVTGPGHLGDPPENMFALLRFGHETLTVSYRTVHPTNPSREVASYTVALGR